MPRFFKGPPDRRHRRVIRYAIVPAIANPAPVYTDGQVSAVTINADGWSADVTIKGWAASAGSVTYAFGYTGTTLGTPKLALLVSSLGYDSSGIATVQVRTVHATTTVRKPYPNNAQKNETTSGSDLVIRVALSDCVYSKDKSGSGNSGTDVAVSVLAGFANNGADNTASNVTATNSSAKGYPKLVAKRPWFNFEKIQASTYLLEVIPLGHHVLSNRPFACVKYTATDESSNSVTGTLTSWAASTRPGPVTMAVCSGSISLSTLDKHEKITCHLQAYPWIGDSASVVDTTSESDLSPTQCGPAIFFNDKDSDYPSSIAYVQWSTSTSYTGVAAAIGDNATARANPHPTIWKARQAIIARNLAQYGRSDLNGGIIYIMEGNTEWCWRSSGALDDYPSAGSVSNTDKCELLITRDPLGTRANTIVNVSSARGVSQNTIKTQRYRIYDLTIGATVDTNPLVQGIFDGTDCCVVHDCLINHTQATDFTYRHATGIVVGSVSGSSSTKGLRGGTASSSTENCILARGNLGTFSSISTDFCVVGNNVITSLNGLAGANNAMVFMNRIERPGSGTLYTLSHTTDMTGHRVIGNCFVNYSNTLTNAYGLSNESATGKYQDAVIAHNSWLGQGSGSPYNGGRLNFMYNSDVGQTQLKDGVRWVGNFCRQFNHKNDVFAADASFINNWSVGYSVGSHGNVYNGGAVDNTMFYGKSSKPSESAANVAFVSPTDGTAAGGDYTPGPSSTLIGLVDEFFIPVDIANRSVSQRACGAYQPV